MTRAEIARLLALTRLVRRSETTTTETATTETATTETWYTFVADLDASDVLSAMIQLARRERPITPRDVRAEVMAMRGRPPVPRLPSRMPDPDRFHALRVACPWCGAAPGEVCTVPGSTTRLRRAPAHPLRLTVAERTGDER